MYKEPKDGDIRLKKEQTHKFQVFGTNVYDVRYTMQKYHTSNGWADMDTFEDYKYI